MKTKTGLKIKTIRTLTIEVESEKLKVNPIYNVPIGVKIQSAYIPKNRKGINTWFNEKF